MKQDTPWIQEFPLPAPTPLQVQALLEHALLALTHGGKRRAGRPATVSTPHLVLAVLWSVLLGLSAQRAVWRLLSRKALGPFAPVSVCEQTLYQALSMRGLTSMRRMFDLLGPWLQQELSAYQQKDLAPFASEVYDLDECILDAVGRWVRGLRDVPAGDAALLAGRICTLFDVRRQQWVRVDVLPEARPNCKVHARQMLSHVPAGALLLFDLGYYAFEWFDALTDGGWWWITRLRAGASFQLLHRFVETATYRESLIFLGAHRSDQTAHAVRLVEICLQGHWHQYLTNICEPRQLSGAEVVRLYARRWDIEMAFRQLKDYLGLRHFWSAKPQVVAVQIWACVILAQCFHALQVRLAGEAGVEVFEVSLPILIEQVCQRVQEQDLSCFSHLLADLVQQGRAIALIRPSARLPIQVPDVLWDCYVWPPPDLLLHRRPHYGHRTSNKTGRRPRQPEAAAP